MSTPDQIKVIHALKTRAGLDDGDYRALLGSFGVESSKHLLGAQAVALVREMRKLPGAGPRPSIDRATGRYAPILQSLWIAAYNLGIVRARDDRAMMRFVERQTDLSHVRFLHDAADATRAIEALKAWMRREAGVDWPKVMHDSARHRAVCEAIVRRLKALDAWPATEATGPVWPDQVVAYGRTIGLPVTLPLYNDKAWMALANALGKRLRAALARAAKAKEAAKVKEAAHV